MKFIKTYLPLIIGAIILFTANDKKLEKPYIYILGIILVMISLFNISRNIRSRVDEDDKKSTL